ncbi:MAG TPA: hypothetical protein VFX33_07255 [Actinomycetales bacterium]|nr:hypothetical protein [Actinomycetales bacterium]
MLEVFGPTRTIDISTFAPWFVLWRPTRPFLLLDLVDGPWITRCGGNGAISTGPRGAARAWSRRIYEQYPEVDGLYYQSSSLPSHRCIALYERAADALPLSYRLHMPLNHPGLRPALRRIAIKYDLRLVL